MQALRDIAIGYLMWICSVSALLGTFIAFSYWVGPPIDDRSRSLLFVGGGGSLFLVTIVIACLVGTVIAHWK